MDDFFDDIDFDCDEFDDGDDDFEEDEFDPEEADQWKERNGDATPNMDDRPDNPDGINWHDFTLGAGLGYEMAYGERRRRRRDDSDI